jgi:DNA-binding response OmpR family regulator
MTKPFVLIIEDDPKLGMIYTTALRQAGFDTDIDALGNQFLEKMSERDPAIILLDLHMPYASGPDILRQIRSDQRWASTPILITTADFIMAKGLNEPADRILIKPVGITRLQKLVTELTVK